MLLRIQEFFFGCQHDGGWPVHGRQHCRKCSAFRFYPDIGATPSRWYRYQYVRETSNQLLERKG